MPTSNPADEGGDVDHLWAPWRMTYIESTPEPGCIFCEKPRQNNDRANGILLRGTTCFAILNVYPYNPGHLMVVPYSHIAGITQLKPDETGELMDVTQQAVAALEQAMAPNGFNIGINQGRSAGAGITDHIHQHVVPRWTGDTNFMTTVGETKVLPELVLETYDRLLPFFEGTNCE